MRNTGNFRKVVVNDETGYFHEWGQAPYSAFEGSSFPITVGIVEHEDGTIGLYQPGDIRFDDDLKKSIMEKLNS